MTIKPPREYGSGTSVEFIQAQMLFEVACELEEMNRNMRALIRQTND